MKNLQEKLRYIYPQRKKLFNVETLTGEQSIVKYWVLAFMLICMTSFTAPTIADDEAELSFSDAQIAQILAPIALYPDTLLTHILIASTYPIEVIDAERWRKQHNHLTDQQIQTQAEGKDWDGSVKALLAFENILTKLSEDLSWMRKLGDAFLQDEERVLASIQQLRQQAEQAGTLAKMDNVEVIKEKKVIIIEPAQPEVIYVPYYDPRTVYGRWHWAHYPPVYWHNPYRYAYHHGPFHWDVGIHISFGFFFSAFHWHNHHVVVNHYQRHVYRPRHKIVTSHHAKRWQHKPEHRRGVAYNSPKLKYKYNSSRVSVSESKKVRLTSSKAHSKAHAKANKNVKYNAVKPHQAVNTKQHAKFREKLTKQQLKAEKRTTKHLKNNAVKSKTLVKDTGGFSHKTTKSYREKTQHKANKKSYQYAEGKSKQMPKNYQHKSLSVKKSEVKTPSYKTAKTEKKANYRKSYHTSNKSSQRNSNRSKVRDKQR